MKKKVVIEGTLCDICGRIIAPRSVERIYDEEFANCTIPRIEKRLTVKMMPTFSRFNDEYRGFGNISPHKVLVCARCAFRFERMFVEWKTECEKEGRKERERRELELMKEVSE